MNGAFFDYEKAMQALLYIAEELQAPKFHQSFKVLYFAEQEYLKEWGNTMFGDTFVKMKDGPVPSFIYNMVKAAGNMDFGGRLDEKTVKYAKQNLAVLDYHLYALNKADLDYLADTEKQCLDRAIERCRNRSFKDIREMSHDAAWEAAELLKPMDTIKIALAGGADELAIAHLQESLQNNNYRFL